MLRINSESGGAIILFATALPILIGIMVFAYQVSQMLQAQAKIFEATEVASLALSASPKNSSQENLNYAEKIVNRYISENASELELVIEERSCFYDDNCMSVGNVYGPYREFVVQATSRHDYWMSYEYINSSSNFKVSGKSTARKYLSSIVDIYLIADFSSSMNVTWDNGKSRLSILKQVASDIANDLKIGSEENDVKSRIALLGYSDVHVKKTNEVVSLSPLGFERIWDKKKYYDYRVKNNDGSTRYLDTVNKMFELKEGKNIPLRAPKENMTVSEVEKLIDYNDNSDNRYPFYDIPLTSDYNLFVNEVNSPKLRAFFSTASWNGLIAAALEADMQTELNPKQVFILLSDGDDGPGLSILDELTALGFCEKIRNRFESKPSVFSGQTEVIMGVIGIGYSPTKNNGFIECFGNENIFHAENGDDVYKYVVQLLNDEVGRLQ
ncbi:TadE/TadG family type IV pilus assembly protein [Vibrio jasicida]|uniref:TadE/TadG family type IV pilus assembly protein n=1 Tax=Vibrio jasicida TaxID=766224 RepID=UPI001640B3A0|nr:TadE/TadG family type IV pilus assembly protein [Vibrio jasicida]